MAGDPEKAFLWGDADVYIAPLTATNPADADTPFAASWLLAGLLDGDAGFSESRSWDKKDHFAWGNILVRTSRRNFKLEKKFTVLEDNEVTRQMIWPGSTDSQLIVPKPVPIKMAFETRDGDQVKRVITRRYAEVDAGDIAENESDLTKVELTASIFTAPGGILFDRQFAGAEA